MIIYSMLVINYLSFGIQYEPYGFFLEDNISVGHRSTGWFWYINDKLISCLPSLEDTSDTEVL